MPRIVAVCPVEEAIQVVGGKWKLLVLRSLLLNGPQRYRDLLNTVTGISQKELTRNLHELADAGLLERDAADPRTAPYSLTRLGEGLMPMFQNMLTWGQELLKNKG
jgi:DNA-binding HxlR family transcriptional regulator